MNNQIITKTDFKDLKLKHRGKVRDVYDLGDSLLIVATDRISAFDIVFNEGVTDKGKILTKISKFWFDKTNHIIENHILTFDVKEYPTVCRKYEAELIDRSMLVKKTNPILIEAVVRGYISGSAWSEYQISKSICGIKLADGLVESEKLTNPIFTPATKAEVGEHDENISFDETIKKIGIDKANFVKNKAIEIYNFASTIARDKGIIIADTKMEFGVLDNEIILIDELLTPDSSRFWNSKDYVLGSAQKSFDKQFLRDYLISINFNKKYPAPELPAEIIDNTSKIYHLALQKLTGSDLN